MNFLIHLILVLRITHIPISIPPIVVRTSRILLPAHPITLTFILE